ncbi:hypothetical protein T265_04394 [Opisthorchis viverrini]|uniref:Protein-L-isoaspartate(D-aspartate) O-methyltransferase n=1 Tax=Opisthorchis viverrini TaxID=6198 RepID=A0A074ZN75_OPIVI|nr:hypothetical protein T265_04394 [Opisthorchis viverrini]KER28853.1 hypothetical protein T265_04394 [Opisthorchis viverrini]
MGASASRGWDNESLIDKLLDGGLSLSPDLERAMRLVDRGDYFEEKSSRAYMDLAWRSGSLHLSAPSIYISALNNLDLAPGQHFLNIGSGSCYLSTIVGLILGYKGINHGIELNENNVAFSKQRLTTFLASSDAPCERDFCVPHFLHGNIFNLVVPPSVRNGSNNRTAAPQDSGEDSDSDAPEDEDMHLSVNEDPDAVQNMEVNPNETAPVGSQVGERQASETDGHGTRPSGRLRTAVLKIDPPPVVSLAKADSPSTNGVKQWPTYDRIYVGGGIRSRAQLQALLRFLKIGGIMVAPVQDELLKITRISEDRISRIDLLSVSFASLVVPPANSEAHPIEPPPLEEVPSLLRLCARFIRQLLRTPIELRQHGRPTLGRMIEVESYGAMKKKRKKKKERLVGDISAEDGDSPSTSYLVAGSEESESDNSGPTDDVHPANGSTIVDNNDGSSSRDGQQTSSHSHRSESPDSQRDSGSMVRFLHHLLLRSRMGRSGGPTPPRPNDVSAAEESRQDGNSPSTQSDDQSQILVLNLSHEQDPPNAEDTMENRMRFHLRFAQRLFANIISSEEEQDTPENLHEAGRSSEEKGVNETVEESENAEDHSVTDNESNQRLRQEKRRRGVKYQPPSYRYRDEMRRILSEELHLPEFFIRQVFVM